jgi:hypothetical protein
MCKPYTGVAWWRLSMYAVHISRTTKEQRMPFNAELADAVLAQIDAHPEMWKQAVYYDTCGTAGCFAGWAARLTGWRWLKDREIGAGYIVARPGPDGSDVRMDVATVAAKELGLNVFDSSELFSAINSREVLGEMVEKLKAGKPLSYYGYDDDDDSED